MEENQQKKNNIPILKKINQSLYILMNSHAVETAILKLRSFMLEVTHLLSSVIFCA